MCAKIENSHNNFEKMHIVGKNKFILLSPK